MRVTNQMIFNQSMINIQMRYNEVFRMNEEVVTGKRINRPSDDPVDAGKVLEYKSLLGSIEQYKKNVETGSTWLNYTEASLLESGNIMRDAKVLTEQLATGTYNEDQRKMLVTNAEQLFERLMQAGNIKVSDRYLFSGFKTDTKTFTRDNDFNIEYHGDNGKIQFSVQQGIRVTVNTTGHDAFINGTNCFDVLRDLRKALSENDQEATGELLPRIDEALNQINTERAYIGTSMNRMDAAKMTLEDFAYNTSELLSATEETDLANAVTRLRAQEIALEATLKSTSMVTRLSLVHLI